MKSIDLLGSDEQKARWLPGLAAVELFGAFALTEPTHGSDSVALETSARRDGSDYVLNGAKRWIGNATIADVVVVWARDEDDGQVKGFLVEGGTPGFDARRMEGKVSVRAVWQADITLTDVRVPADAVLPGAQTFKDTGRVLASTRSSVAWGALGHATAAYEVALAYAGQREQFGRPLSKFQLVQDKLVRMLAEVTAMQLYCMRLAQLLGVGAAHRHDLRAGQAQQHPQGPRGHPRGPRAARRQRDPARLPRRAAHGRHRGHLHLRGHRRHPGAHRRPRRSPGRAPSPEPPLTPGRAAR